MRCCVFENLWEGLKGKHVQVQEVRGLLVNGLLELLLSWGRAREITDTAGGLVIFSERLEKSLSGFASAGELVGCWGFVWVPE